MTTIFIVLICVKELELFSMSTGKRLIKNTAFMYVRMILLMIISLYTSRVVLKELGVDDFGIYNLVGSVVAMFSALRGLFSSSIQRFINYEMGKGNNERLRIVFNMGTIINIILALIFVLAIEVVGYWFFNYKINIDPSRIAAAEYVFQLSILSAVISMLTTPYDALIVAYERMDFYAIMAILEGVLRLLIVFMLVLSPVDKLIFYAILQLVVSIIIRFINAMYCKRNFPASHYKKCWDKSLFKEMSSYAGWNFFGNMAYTLTNSGLNMVLNIFGGASVNAARGIAYQIKSATTNFLSSMMIVVNPYNTKKYASGEIDKFFTMLYTSSKIYFIVQLCLVIPITYLTNEILYIWLKQVPDYAIIFTQLILVYSLIRSIHYPIESLFKSFGKMRTYQITEGIILSLPLIFSYLLLAKGYPCYILFVTMIFFEIINFVIVLYIAHTQTNLSIKKYVIKVVLPCFLCFILAVCGFILNYIFIQTIFIRISLSILMDLLCIFVMFFIGFSKYERNLIISVINRR